MIGAWAELPPTQPLAPLVPCTLLVYTDDEHRLIQLARPRATSHLLATQVTRRGTYGVTRQVLAEIMVGVYAATLLGDQARAMLLPPLVKPPPSRSWLRWWPRPLRLLGQDELGVDLDTVHEFALAIERGQWWRGRLPEAAAGNPSQRVEHIRLGYQELRTDLVYRIENPALFDPAEPTTAEFEAQLAAFDPSQDLVTRARQAHRIELAYTVAKEHAERVGLGHVADEHRGELRRAAKAARLAEGATTDGERAAALAQVQRILDSLALYYLPERAEMGALPSPGS